MRREITRDYSKATKKLRREQDKILLKKELAKDGTSYRDVRRSYQEVYGVKPSIRVLLRAVTP